jgi:hypothetical protein
MIPDSHGAGLPGVPCHRSRSEQYPGQMLLRPQFDQVEAETIAPQMTPRMTNIRGNVFDQLSPGNTHIIQDAVEQLQ